MTHSMIHSRQAKNRAGCSWQTGPIPVCTDVMYGQFLLHHEGEDLRFVYHVVYLCILVRHVGNVGFLTPDDGRDPFITEIFCACALPTPPTWVQKHRRPYRVPEDIYDL